MVESAIEPRPANAAPGVANTGGVLTSFDIPAKLGRRDDEGARRFRVQIDPQRTLRAPVEEAVDDEPAAENSAAPAISPINPLRSR